MTTVISDFVGALGFAVVSWAAYQSGSVWSSGFCAGVAVTWLLAQVQDWVRERRRG